MENIQGQGKKAGARDVSDRMKRLVLVGLLVACGGEKRSEAPVSRPLPTPVLPDASISPGPPGTAGTCRALPKDSETNCPQPMDVVRGDGVGTSPDAPKVSKTVLPPWDMDAMRDWACAFACANEGADAYLLAWSIIEDDRPLRNHNAAFVVRHKDAPKWTVVVMYQHAFNKAWNINVNFHTPSVRPIVDFPAKPSAKEIDDVITATNWQWGGDHFGFRVLAGNVIDELWQIVVREPAPQHFENEP